ncbi:MAG: hypothetical protein FJX25_02200 [Alphaproteobacteria bacterium]|nr:hypothetical protein [Alphaproteobacteria bacterium]
MKNDPDLELQRRLATELADAHFRGLTGQERVARSTDPLAEARALIADTQRRLNAAQKSLDRIGWMAWTEIEQRDDGS